MLSANNSYYLLNPYYIPSVPVLLHALLFKLLVQCLPLRIETMLFSFIPISTSLFLLPAWWDY